MAQNSATPHQVSDIHLENFGEMFERSGSKMRCANVRPHNVSYALTMGLYILGYRCSAVDSSSAIDDTHSKRYAGLGRRQMLSLAVGASALLVRCSGGSLENIVPITVMDALKN